MRHHTARTAPFRAAAFSILALSLGLAVAPASSSQGNDDTNITTDIIAASLSGPQKQSWENLSESQKSATARILNDPEFGSPEAVGDLETKYPELQVTTTSSPTPDEAPEVAGSGERSSWVRQDWNILSITYTSATTRIGYKYKGSTVTSVERCYGSYYNYVPLRSIDHNSWSTIKGGKATCMTEWSLSRPLHKTVYGTQGLRVDGDGNILRTWKL